MAPAQNGTARQPKTSATDLCIIGGGIAGLLTAQRAKQNDVPYIIVERSGDFGGVWETMSNNYSYLQAWETSYCWDPKYRLNTEPLSKNSGSLVLFKMREFASDLGAYCHAWLGTECVTILEQRGSSHRYRVVCKDLSTGQEKHVLCNFLCICAGYLRTQYTAEERGVKDTDKFRGVITQGGKHNSLDCAVGNTDLTGKRVVIMGSGSFAAEALEAAARSHAQHVTIVSRPRYRWIIPFSRQYTITGVAMNPWMPWCLKLAFIRWYLDRYWYTPCRLAHWMPTGDISEMDYSAQANDGYFRLSYEGKLTALVDKVERMEADAVVLKEGGRLLCDMFVVAAGCKTNTQPEFLQDLGLDLNDMHNNSYLGKNPRIACIADGVFSYTPLGPHKQLDMFFHTMKACKAGKEKEARAALWPTPLVSMGEHTRKGGRFAGLYTFFEYRHWWSTLNIFAEERGSSYIRTLGVDRSWLGRLGLKLRLLAEVFWMWLTLQAAREMLKFPVYGPGVGDAHQSPVEKLNFEQRAKALPGSKVL